MNLIALMPPLSLIKCLKIQSLQATFVFFCAISVVQINLLIQISYDDNLFVLFYFLLKKNY